MKNKKWNYINVDEEKVLELITRYKIPKLISVLLVNRGLINDDEINSFMNCSQDQLFDPFLLSDMQKAVDRIKKAIEQKEKITIYGDYDVDGITSISILMLYLKSKGLP